MSLKELVVSSWSWVLKIVSCWGGDRGGGTGGGGIKSHSFKFNAFSISGFSFK